MAPRSSFCISPSDGRPAIFKVRGVTRPEQWLGWPTCSCSSTSSTLKPSAAMCCATVDPLGPAPTTTVSYKSRDLTVQSVGSFRLACSHGQRAYGDAARAMGYANSHQYIIPHPWQTNKAGRVEIGGASFRGCVGEEAYSGWGMINSWPTSMRPGSVRPLASMMAW